MQVLNPFQLLEINIISAQDLEPVSKKIKTYATAWVHSERKLSTRIDNDGNTNPTWNDKFVFRVDEEFLRLDTAAVMIEIYATRWLRDTLVGSVRVLINNLIPPQNRSLHHPRYNFGMRCVALQVRRPSGRPQGILNIGVAVLDSSMRSMPLYKQLNASAVGFHDLMGEEDSHHDPNYHHQNVELNPSAWPPKPMLRRSRSERSGLIGGDDTASVANSSIIAIAHKLAVPDEKASSIISISDVMERPFEMNRKKGKASSVINGVELEKPKARAGKKKASSMISGSIFSTESHIAPPLKREAPRAKPTNEKTEVDSTITTEEKKVDEKSIPKSTRPGVVTPPKEAQAPVPTPIIGKPPISRGPGYDYGVPKGPMGNGKFIMKPPHKPGSIWSDSEVGPSPSEVAAAMVQRRYPLEDDGSSVLDGWSLDESVEGLRSKLERWRTELPPLYDRGPLSSSTFPSSSQHTRRNTHDGSTGLFSCFGNIFGYECQCICGKPKSNAHRGTRFHSPSIGSTRTGRSF